MRASRSMISMLLLLVACATTGGPGPAPVPSPEAEHDVFAPAEAGPPTVIAFVRHAEKADDGTDDPPLTEAGERRARCLAQVLEPLGADRLWVTPYRRTAATLEPLAARTAAKLEVLPAPDIDRWTRELREAAPGSRIVVSAHSNTIPAMVTALGGDPGPLDDHGNIPHQEYDRLLVLVLDANDRHLVTLRQRYCVVPADA